MSENNIEELKAQFALYPDEARRFFRSGFDVASRLSVNDRKTALAEFLSHALRGKRLGSGISLSPIPGLNKREMDQLAATFSVVVGILTDSNATARDFSDAATGNLFDEQHSEAAMSLATLVCEQRAALSTALQKAQLSGSVLPSLEQFNLAVDLRLKIAEGVVRTSVPVVVAYISTDVDGKSLGFQMTKTDVEEMINKLQEISEAIKTAETLLRD